MSAPRLATIPFEHIEAELAVFPLASEASFRLGISLLDPAISRNDGLWREAEKYISNTLPSVPSDEMTAIRDKLWFDSADPGSDPTKTFESVTMIAYVRRLARTYLDSTGRPIELSENGHNNTERSTPAARLRWSWICRALPPDFLRVARGVVDPDANPFTLHPVLEQMLRDRGFAETHLHLGASPDFSLAWASLMDELSKTKSSSSDFESFGADFDHGNDLGTWILYAAVVRLVLAKRLFFKSPGSEPIPDLAPFTLETHGGRFDILERRRLAATLFEFREGKWIDDDATHKQKAHRIKRFARIRILYARLIGPSSILSTRQTERTSLRKKYKPESRADVYSNDPLADIVGWHSTEALSPETIFLVKALEHLEQNRGDREFAALFWQLVRIRCIVYRHVVQRPLTPGLQWFVRFFSRIKPLRKGIPEIVQASTAAYICGENRGLRSLEVRLGTEESVSECLRKVRDVQKGIFPAIEGDSKWHSKQIFNREDAEKFAKAKKNAAEVELGIVFHFSRKRGGGWEKGKLNAFGLDNSYPGKPGNRKLRDTGNPTGFRFAKFYLQQKRHAQALVSLFRTFPEAMRIVRGFDLCTDEAGVPVWVMAPLIRWVQSAGQSALKHLKRRGEFDIPATRLSIHAGEDFVHLLTGLRRLDEAVTHLKLQEGDRLGHALALGVDSSGWCNRVGRVVISREERLFDLIWEWGCYARAGFPVNSERLAYVRTQLVLLAHEIFRKTCSPEDLMIFYDKLHSEETLGREGYPDRFKSSQKELLSKSSDVWTEVLRDYLTDTSVWKRGRAPQTLNINALKHEREALSNLQKELRRKVGRLCLTIEVNPSSNLLIGDLGNFESHPLWRLKPVTQEDDVPPVSVCIGSDDPLTFATTLPHEYQLLFDALILAGHSHDTAMKWLNVARKAGMQARFTLPSEPDKLARGLRTPNLVNWERPQSPP
jgi:hypothetical protein